MLKIAVVEVLWARSWSDEPEELWTRLHRLFPGLHNAITIALDHGIHHCAFTLACSTEISPQLLSVPRNAQFLGADIDQFTPGKFSLRALAGILLTLFVTSWAFTFGPGCVIS